MLILNGKCFVRILILNFPFKRADIVKLGTFIENICAFNGDCIFKRINNIGCIRLSGTKAEIEKIRGVSSEHAVSKLVEYNLVQELGRLDAPGRPLLFGTTEEFLRSFGVSSIDELPVLSPVQVEEFKQEAEEEMHVKLDV